MIISAHNSLLQKYIECTVLQRRSVRLYFADINIVLGFGSAKSIASAVYVLSERIFMRRAACNYDKATAQNSVKLINHSVQCCATLLGDFTLSFTPFGACKL